VVDAASVPVIIGFRRGRRANGKIFGFVAQAGFHRATIAAGGGECQAGAPLLLRREPGGGHGPAL